MRISRLELLQSAIEAPQLQFQGLDPYPTIEAKGAALAFHIARNHPLQDGNKRLAFMASEQFFFINGYDLNFEIDEGEKTFVDLAAGNLTIEELRDWFKAHLTEINRPAK